MIAEVLLEALDRRRQRYERMTDADLTAEAAKVETHAGEVGRRRAALG